MLAEQLLTPEEKEELHRKLFEIEKMVFETEMVSREKEDGNIVWFEKIKGRLSLYDIEMAMESNPDFYSFFERDDGSKVTKFDVERELNRVKSWLFDKVRQRSSRIRFQRGF